MKINNIEEMTAFIKSKLLPNATELEIARCIYIQLGKIKSFSPKYYFATDKEQQKLRRLAKNSNINENIKCRDLICTNISKLYADIAKQFGLDVKIDTTTDDPTHSFNIINLQDGRNISADLQKDLYRVQTNCQTKYFGTNIHNERIIDEISTDILKDIDKKINYISSDYNDKIIFDTKEELADKTTLHDKLKYVLNKQGLWENTPENMGHMEVRAYTRRLLNELFPSEFKEARKKEIFYINCQKTLDSKEENAEPKYTSCIFSHEKKSKDYDVYLYSPKHKQYVDCPLTTLKEFENNGLKLGVLKNEVPQNLRQELKKIKSKKNKNDESPSL